jgi:hypothetical protein
MGKPTAQQPAQFVLISGPFWSQDRVMNIKKKNMLPNSTLIEPHTDLLQKSLAPQL